MIYRIIISLISRFVKGDKEYFCEWKYKLLFAPAGRLWLGDVQPMRTTYRDGM